MGGPTLLACVLMLGSPSSLPAQGDGLFGVGLEFQVYPSGGIFAARGSIRLDDNDALFGYLEYNLAERGNNGKHQGEEGGGPGVGLAWRHYFGQHRAGWHVGVRTDVWALAIDWTESTSNGQTDIVVFQPTAQGGYTWLVDDDWAIDVGASVGAEINVTTDGSPVGEGAIVLLGVGTEYRF